MEMDARRSGSYLRDVKLRRPSRAVTLATVAACCVLGAGGYLLGSRSDGVEPAATAPLQPAKPAGGGETILVPSKVELPRR